MKAALDGRTWGRWQYKHSTFALLLMGGERVAYEIDLEQCGDSAEILDWIVQISEKADISRADVGHLVEAMDELADGIQGKVCPGGESKSFDFKAHLTRAASETKGED
jgi:hypothetical protein